MVKKLYCCRCGEHVGNNDQGVFTRTCWCGVELRHSTSVSLNKPSREQVKEVREQVERDRAAAKAEEIEIDRSRKKAEGKQRLEDARAAQAKKEEKVVAFLSFLFPPLQQLPRPLQYPCGLLLFALCVAAMLVCTFLVVVYGYEWLHPKPAAKN